ncbi:MAG: Maf family nucleotide pyrophosphatase [Halofilum sp. (in: g-proteobacteria)]
MTAQRLILASTSPYRRDLLERLRVPFETASPDCDETAMQGETPADLVTRLARDKAASVAGDARDALVIGSDQVAALGDRILTKPGDHATAFEQLRASSGASVVFHTGLALIDSTSGREACVRVDYTVDFRGLTDDEIERYLSAEAPWDCAGSIRSEGYGIVLFRRMRGDDPTALIGLPLIRLRELLGDFGWPLP